MHEIVEQVGELGIEAHAGLQVGKRVGVVGVAAGLRDDDVRAKDADRRRDDALACHQDVIVARLGG